MLLYTSRLKADQRGNYQFQLHEDIKPFEYNGELVRFAGPVSIMGEIREHQDYSTVKGHINGKVILKCSRCLGEFVFEIDTDFQRKYSEIADQEDVLPMKGDRIDIAEPVNESILLELPIKGLCREDCRGICPVCGGDRNENQCDCSQDDIDPRMAELRKLLKE